MTDFETIKTIEDQYAIGVYSKRALAISHGDGAYLYDSSGKKYIDCVGGQGSANVGHANPAVAAAITRQAQNLIGCPEMFYNETRATLMKKLCEISNMNRIFLCNSGTEANEAALKFARILTGRTEVIATMRGFHGRTMGALSATWETKYRKPFEPLVPNFKHIAFNDLEALEKAISNETAAVILEIVQGEGGVRPGHAEYFQMAQRLCRKHGALLILDEIQTGFGRTGRWFACQHYGLEPDLLTLAKSMGGGIPMGATLMRNGLEKLPLSVHGSTFGGNPLACAASLAVVDCIETQHLIEKAAENGAWFLEKLRAIESPQIREVRGLGLMVGLELKQKVAPIIAELTKRGILTLPAGMSVIRFLPPLVISREDLAYVTEQVKKILQ